MRRTILAVAALSMAALLAATVARSTPRGALTPATAGFVSAFAFDPASPDVVYAGTEGNGSHLFKTTDGGEHWRLVSGRGWAWVEAVAADPTHPGTVYAGTGKGVYKTRNGGRDWQRFNRGLDATTKGAHDGWVYWLGVDPANSKILYEYNIPGDIRRSVNGGRTWKFVFSNSRHVTVIGTACCLMTPGQPLTVYAAFWPSGPTGGKSGLYRSANGGRTWRRLALAVQPDHTTVAFAADRQRGTSYVAVGSYLFSSTNGSRDWHPIGNGLPRNQPVAVVASFETDGVYVSSDEGKIWTRSWPASGPASGVGVDAVTVDPAHPSTVFAYEYQPKSLILRSTDGGRTWTVLP
jgi:photosystem II stability/assembly factor-like uncharacterized protein